MITAIVAFVTWLAAHIGKRLALMLMFVTLITTFYATMVIVVAAASAAWVYVTPDYVSSTLAMFMPSQVGGAMAAVMTASVARWVYDTSIKVAAIAVLIS